MVQQEIKELVNEVLIKLYPQAKANFSITHPDNEANGDYSANIALILAKQVSKAPLEIAEEIVKAFPAHQAVKSVKAVAPGFINIFLNEDYLGQELKKILTKKETYGRQKKTTPQKVMFEY